MSHQVSGTDSADKDHINRTQPYHRFPEIPEGVSIIPFKDFKEVGIRRSLGRDGIERDHRGIPTLALRCKHDTDVSKTNPKPKTPFMRPPLRFKKEWWDDWEHSEHLRIHGPYDHSISSVELFRRGAADFQKYRQFPMNVFKPLWESTFKIYAGILGTIPVWKKASDKPSDEEDVSDDDFDTPQFQKQLRPREPYELYDFEPPVAETSEEIQALLAAGRRERDARAERFLADPAKAIQIYLSSYIYHQNLILSDQNLVNAPHLLRFFVKFLLRNEVLPHKRQEDGLRTALEIIDLAAKELPLTSRISKVLPDSFSAACRNLWGRSAGGYTPILDSASAFESILREENIEVVSAEDVLGGEAVEVEADDGGWAADAPSAADWEIAAPSTLFTLWGPTALPLTHAPGIVERSVRRIVSINPPVPEISTPLRGSGATAVERGLRETMFSVELGTWPDWDSAESEYSVPEVLWTLSPVGLAPTDRPHSVEEKITLLVEPTVVEHLSVGMGLAGVWVQFAPLRGHDFEDDSASSNERRECGVSDQIWYLEELVMVLPSYWLV
ncbi:hypothetical protein DFH07DRAFT_944245 [Mycena maculata]|uniref:Uncharacterized protein n=1 Tax=Mycena maculata TaxID=230809 RepID=A0AAD7MXK2_9AGAR|nr:hypothetical protein DFH07DRAFT_944245 [Mycena maculata]